MRSIWREILFALFMGAVIPGLLLSFGALILEDTGDQTSQTELTEPETMSKSGALTIRLRRENGATEEMDMDAYLVGVVLAEMPASFEYEALKAQAVVARTYAQRAYTSGGKHGDGSICTQYNCCQAYISEADYLQKGGTEEDLGKIRGAVMETSGLVLTFEGELIEATYFSCSGGITEDAAAVWGTDYPYLRSVVSPGEENAAHYTDSLSFSVGELQEVLGIDLPEWQNNWFGPVTYTAGNGVDTIMIGGKEYKGTELRSLLGLRSTIFTVETTGDTVVFHTRGYGHRVGMSQYGADAMAVTGSTFDEILSYYYQGTELTNWEQI